MVRARVRRTNGNMYCVSRTVRIQLCALALVPSAMSVLVIARTCTLYALRNDTRCGHNLPGLLQVGPFRVLQAIRAPMYNGLYEAMTLYELCYMGILPIRAAQRPLDTDISSNIYHLPSDADEADP